MRSDPSSGRAGGGRTLVRQGGAGVKLAPGEAGNAPTVAARIPQSIERALVERARSTGARRSEVIREALAAYLAPSS